MGSTFLSVAAFGAGRILGLDAYTEQYDVGGQALVEHYRSSVAVTGLVRPWSRGA